MTLEDLAIGMPERTLNDFCGLVGRHDKSVQKVHGGQEYENRDGTIILQKKVGLLKYSS